MNEHAQLMGVVEQYAGAFFPDATVQSAFWGDLGASISTAAPLSVPRPTDNQLTESELHAKRQDGDDQAIWSLLYYEPYFELLSLTELDRISKPVGSRPGDLFATELAGMEVPWKLADLLPEMEQDQVQALWNDVCASFLQVFCRHGGAAGTMDDLGFEHRYAAARCLTALLTREIDQTPDGGARDELFGALKDALHAEAMAPGQLSRALRKAMRPAGRAVQRAVLNAIVDRRADYVNRGTPAIGDILLFLADGAQIRARIARAIEAHGPVILLAHSLGGIAAVDLLVERPDLPVTHLVTVGSQAGLLHEIGALPSLTKGAQLPGGFPPWLNVYDPRDALAFLAEPVFDHPDRDSILDIEVNTRQPFPQCHSAYFRHGPMWDHVETFVGSRPCAD